MPKKLKYIKKLALCGYCECGYEHKLRTKDLDMKNSNKTDTEYTIMLKDIFTCPNCGETYDGLYEDLSNRKPWHKILTIGVASLIAVMLLVGGIKLFNTLFYSPPTDFQHMTNKQYNNFMKWDQKQQEQKRENQPVFNNNNQ